MDHRILVWTGAMILLLLLGVALLGPAIAPYSPREPHLEQDLLTRSQDQLLGTNKLGRDILSRILYGARISVLVGTSTVGVSLLIGLSIGSLSGYCGGWVDQLLMRLVDVLMAFPGILLALCLIGWTGYARLARGEILALREREFIHAARALGGSPGRIIVLHLLPNLLPPLLIQATFGMAAAIIAEGGLGFLGLGVQPPTPSWGSMLNEGRQFLLIAPHLTTFPGLAIMITVLGLNLVGDGMRDRLEKRGK